MNLCVPTIGFDVLKQYSNILRVGFECDACLASIERMGTIKSDVCPNIKKYIGVIQN